MGKKVPIGNNRPELDIDTMSIHGEMIKSLLDESETFINFNIEVQNGKTEAKLTVSARSSSGPAVTKSWTMPTTRNTILKLVALLDNSSVQGNELKEALSNAYTDANANVDFVKKAWGLKE